MAAPVIERIVELAIPLKLNRSFDYRLPANFPEPAVGCRVSVRFGRQQLIAWVTGIKNGSDWPLEKLRTIDAVVDTEPLPNSELWRLMEWTAGYYHHPLGEVITTAMPGPFAKSGSHAIEPTMVWQLTKAGADVDTDQLGRAAKQAAVLRQLGGGPQSREQLSQIADSAVLRRLQKKGWLEQVVATKPSAISQPGPNLSQDQQRAVSAVASTFGTFQAHLLDGVTGSGKTEVYLRCLEQTLVSQYQGLVLVPEIALTPQLLERFQARLGCEVAALHSGMTDRQRIQIWLRARAGDVPIVVGTRSAVFCPFRRLGLVIVDEEHDLSLKQHDGLRYSARDLAVQRARMNTVPVILGSATPSLESLNNALSDRYQHLQLAERPGAAHEVNTQLIDLRAQQPTDGLSTGLLTALRQVLGRGEQALVFLNRRGFAPVLICNACGWLAECPRCDSRMTWHRTARRLRCHHCGRDQSVPKVCPDCRSTRLEPIGEGTQRLDAALKQALDGFPVFRLDRDSTRSKQTLPTIRAKLNSGEPCVVVGTQMLAKGHDFPNVTLVGVVNLDQALFSSDFRAAERAAQLLVQVAGRAGRGDKPGLVMIQTHHPDHPLFTDLIQQGYRDYAKGLLRERHAANFPPYGFMAMLRAEANDKSLSERFLREANQCISDHEVSAFGPLPAPIERVAGRYRSQLVLLSRSRQRLQQMLKAWVPQLYELKTGSRVRWSLDVDPQDNF